MATTLTAKPANAVFLYTWEAPLADGDTLVSASLSIASGDATVTGYSVEDQAVSLFVSGGTAGTTTAISLTSATANGETLPDTLYVPISATSVQSGTTVRDVCSFALSKIVGIGETPGDDLSAKALEILNDMLAEWRIDGLDVGIPGPLALNDSLVVADEYIAAVKYNLTVELAEEFGRDLTPGLMRRADNAKRLVATRLLNFAPLSFEGPCIAGRYMTGIDDL